MKNKKLLLILLFLVILILSIKFIFLNEFVHNSEKVLNKNWILKYQNKKILLDETFHMNINFNNDHILINKFKLKKNIKNPVLIMPMVFFNSYKIYLNDKLLGTLGDYKNNYSNIWTYTKAYNVNNLLKKNKLNTIKITSNKNFEIGFGLKPVIMNISKANKYIFGLNLYNNMFPLISIGIMLSISVIFFIINLSTIQTRFHVSIYIALSFILLAFYLFEFIFIEYLPFSYLIFKKITFSSLYLSNIFFLIGFTKYFNLKFTHISKFLIVISSVGIGLIIFALNQVIYIRKFYSYFNFIIIFYIINFLYLSYKKYKNTGSKKILAMFWGILIASPFVIHDIFINFVITDKIYLSQIGIVFIYIFLAYTILHDFTLLNKKYILEKKRADLNYKKSLKDPLTGIFNRKVLEKLETIIDNTYSALMLDIDDFKEINDNYSHLIGDSILKNISNILKKNLRDDDVIIRYGGDEFLIFLSNSNMDIAKKVASKINNVIRKTNFKNEIKITCSIGIKKVNINESLNKIIEISDKNMYKAKEMGKNQIFPE